MKSRFGGFFMKCFCWFLMLWLLAHFFPHTARTTLTAIDAGNAVADHIKNNAEATIKHQADTSAERNGE